MNIPDKAVEAAAKAEENALYPGAWDEMSAIGQKLRVDRLRPILESAAPFIAAQALRDAAEDLAQKLHEPGCNWGTRANDAGHLLALADLQESTQ